MASYSFVYSNKRVTRKMPPRIAHPPSSLTLCSAAAELAHKQHGLKQSSRRASEHRIRSSVSSRGVLCQKLKTNLVNGVCYIMRFDIEAARLMSIE